MGIVTIRMGRMQRRGQLATKPATWRDFAGGRSRRLPPPAAESGERKPDWQDGGAPTGHATLRDDLARRRHVTTLLPAVDRHALRLTRSRKLLPGRIRNRFRL